MEIKVTAFLNRYAFYIGIFAIIVSAITWWMDLSGMVIQCPYCRVQRTMIGCLGLLAILPKHRNGILRYLSYLFAFFGANISGDQMFLSIKTGDFPTMNAMIAMGAFILIGILVVVTHYRYIKK